MAEAAIDKQERKKARLAEDADAGESEGDAEWVDPVRVFLATIGLSLSYRSIGISRTSEIIYVIDFDRIVYRQITEMGFESSNSTQKLSQNLYLNITIHIE